MRKYLMLLILMTLMILPNMAQASELWKITYYCSCKICCGKSDGITASGEKARYGIVACNWLPFGTIIWIDGEKFVVKDRGAKSLFGDSKHHVKHLDIWLPSHARAKHQGVRYMSDARVQIGGVEK